MAFVIVTFIDGSLAVLTAAQYFAIEPTLVAEVRIVGDGRGL